MSALLDLCKLRERCCLVQVPGNLEMLEWMAAQDPPCPINNAALMVCARDGDMHMLHWALKQDPIPCELSRPIIPYNLPPAKHGRLLPLVEAGWTPVSDSGDTDTAALLESMHQRRQAFYVSAKVVALREGQGTAAVSFTSLTHHSLAGDSQQQQPIAASLGSLPRDMLCKIACEAQIDFAWMHAF